jgi:hypothetical protein
MGGLSTSKAICGMRYVPLQTSTTLSSDLLIRQTPQMFLGGSIFKIDPNERQIVRTIALPAKQTTSLVWGGKNLDMLYVTSGANPDFTPEIENVTLHPYDGSIFKVEGVRAQGQVRHRYG